MKKNTWSSDCTAMRFCSCRVAALRTYFIQFPVPGSLASTQPFTLPNSSTIWKITLTSITGFKITFLHILWKTHSNKYLRKCDVYHYFWLVLSVSQKWIFFYILVHICYVLRFQQRVLHSTGYFFLWYSKNNQCLLRIEVNI